MLKTVEVRKDASNLRPLGSQETYFKDSSEILREEPVLLKHGPDDLALFREKFMRAKIYHWDFRSTDILLSESANLNERLLGGIEEGGLEYFKKVYVIADTGFGGTTKLGIDLNPDRFGWIGNYWYEGNLAEGNFPVVAHSFSEWLERTLDAGPNATCHYWESPDFVDMGPAIPGDPNYKPRNRHQP